MGKRLTQHQLEIITDLYHEVSGQAGSFVSADTEHHSPLYWLAHECRGLIAIRKTKRKGKTYRKIALTEAGVLWCESHGIYARESIPSACMPLADKRERVTISFQLSVADDTVGQVEVCKGNKDFVPVIRLAMALYTAIGYPAFYRMAETAVSNLDIFKMTPDELAGLYADMENERQRILLEHAALEVQSLEVKQFHDMFRSIDTKLDRLQNTAIPANMPPVSGLRSVQGSTQASGIRTLNTPQFEVPSYDDDEDLLDVQEDSGAGKRASENFLRSIGALNS
jgi:hypothetical protein